MVASFLDFVGAAGENPFSFLNPDGDCYRLSVKSSCLDHRIVRLERTRDSGGVLVAHWMGNGERNWGYTMRVPLEARHWRCLEAILEFSNFWALPEHGGGGGFDGAFYTVEGCKPGSRHRVCRWSPSERDQESFSLLCSFLEHLADLNCDRPDGLIPLTRFDIPDAHSAETLEPPAT